MAQARRSTPRPGGSPGRFTRRPAERRRSRRGQGGPGAPAGSRTVFRGAPREYLYLGSNLVQVVVSAAVTPVVTRLVTPQEYGHLATAVVMVQLLFSLESMGLVVGVQKVHAEANGGLGGGRTVLSLAAVMALVMTLGLEASTSLWATSLGFPATSTVPMYAVAWAGLVAVTSVFMALLQSENRPFMYSSVSLVQSVFTQILGLAALLLLGRTTSHYLAGLLVGQVVALCLAVGSAPPALRGLLNVRGHTALLAFSLPLVPEQVATFVLQSSDRFVVQAKLGPVAVGRYSLAYNLGILGATLLAVLNLVWLPPVLRAPPGPERAALLEASRDKLIMLAAPLMLGVSLGAPAVLMFWAPASFDPAGLRFVTTVVALSSMPALLFTSEFRTLVAAGRTKVVGATTVAAALLNILLNLALVPRFGIGGSAVATLVAYSAQAGAAHLVSRRTTRLAPVPLLLKVQCLLSAGAAAACAAVPSTGAWTVIRLVLGTACLAMLLDILRRMRGTTSVEGPRLPYPVP